MKSHAEKAARTKKYYENNSELICAHKRQRYVLLFVCSLLIVYIISRYSLKPPSYTMIQECVERTYSEMIRDENYRDRKIYRKF